MAVLDLETLLNVPLVDELFDLSPDGKWVAFSWNPTGRWELYSAPTDGQEPPRQI
ncbi:MAG: hypothetical protein D6793_07075, partial [Thermoflexia bacterium]